MKENLSKTKRERRENIKPETTDANNFWNKIWTCQKKDNEAPGW